MTKSKKLQKSIIFKAFFACIFVIVNFFSLFTYPTFAEDFTYTENPDGSIVLNQPDSPTSGTSETYTENPDGSITINNQTSETGNQNANQNTETGNEETENTCTDESGAIGWLICPTTGALAKAIDNIYGLVEEYLNINPIEGNSDSTIHTVWEYVRNITNIVFIILILVVIWSQLTGIGISNYGIKRVLPRVIISAILVNVSFIICQLAVDVSNIIGASLRDFFLGIEQDLMASGAHLEYQVTWTELFSLLTGSTTTLVTAGILTGGLKRAFWLYVPIILGGFASILIGLITIALRQAVVSLLVMISPLAFVARLLPNTESWFIKWKNLLTRMLVFYPAFALLYGASSLAGWAIMASADSLLGIILGLGVQVYPLFACWSLMKMSGTILGTINSKLSGIVSKPLSTLSSYSNQKAAIARAEYTARQIKRPFSVFSPSSWTGRLAQGSANDADRLAIANKEIGLLTSTDLAARKRGTRIIGYDKAGMPIYSNYYRPSREMRREYSSRVRNLNSMAATQELNNSLDELGSHMAKNGIKDAQLSREAAAQGQNFLNLKTQQVAARINARSDQRFYSEKVKEAAARAADGTIINPSLYHDLIERGAGADYYIDPSLTGEALAKAEELSQAAAISVISDAYDALEADRKITTAKYTTYFSKQVTKEVLNQYDNMLRRKDIEGIVAAQNILAQRGDYDKIGENLSKYMDQEGYVELGTDFANVLALNLLGMKDYDPKLARLGKHINVETWHYTDWDPESSEERRSSYVTMKEFYTGKDAKGIKTKYYAPNLMQGTPLKGIDRTFYADLSQDISKYYTAENFGSEKEAKDAKMALIYSMLPQIISAVPTYAAGSEALGNTMNFLTGLKYDTVKDEWFPEWLKRDENGNWVNKKPNETEAEKSERDTLTKRYLSGMTPNDVINMKTDAFNSCMLRLKLNHGYDMNQPANSPANTAATDAAIAEFRAIFGTGTTYTIDGQFKSGNNVIDRLRAADPSVLAPMKDSVRRALGL